MLFLVDFYRPLMKYIGKSHNLWHRMALGLEQMVFDPTLAKPKRELMDCYDFEPDQTSKNVSVFNSMACVVKYLIKD